MNTSLRSAPAQMGERIFHRLLDVVPDLVTLRCGDSGKSEVPGFMALNLDVLSNGRDMIMMALSHLYKHPSGDMISDPDMQIAVYPALEYAEALTYQDFFGFQAVENGTGAVHAKVQRELNSFLFTWLGNLIAQGHSVKL